jgi:hypothetical protein
MDDTREPLAPSTVEFAFDPSCPWTWVTFRWLVAVTEREPVEVRWRPFSLAHVNRDKPDVPEEYRKRWRVVDGALRIVERLHQDGRHKETERFFSELGLAWHVDQEPWTAATVLAAALRSGLDDETASAYNDHRLDPQVIASTEDALELAGPDIGSPVIVFTVEPTTEAARSGQRRVGFHGPIITEVPPGEGASALWRAVVAAAAVPEFRELKRGRRSPPQVAVGIGLPDHRS